MAQCRARSKRSQERCRKPSTPGHNVCHIHGSKTPRGFGLPQTKTGRYSKVLPVRMAQRYHEALASKDLLSVRDDVATADARLADLFTRVDTGESGALWQALREALEQFARAQATGDIPGMDRQCATMRQLVTQGSDDYQAWSEIYKVWEHRCKLVQTESRTLMTMQQMVSTEELVTMFGVVVDTIQRAVLAHADEGSGRRILADISRDFAWIADREAHA
jgi:hypothetical protein